MGDFKDHIKNSCPDRKPETENNRISFCRGCHANFRSRKDLILHIKSTFVRKCFPAQSILDRIYASAKSDSQRVDQPPLVKKEPGSVEANHCPVQRLPEVPVKREVQESRELLTHLYTNPPAPDPTITEPNESMNQLADDFPPAPENINISLNCSPLRVQTNFNVYSDLNASCDSDTLRNILRSFSTEPIVNIANRDAGTAARNDACSSPSYSIPFLTDNVIRSSLDGQISEVEDVKQVSARGGNLDIEDEDIIEVIEEEDPVKCQESICKWNDKHVPHCKRLEIAQRCGLKQCKPSDLHQCYGFSGNKYIKERLKTPQHLCSKLNFYTNLKYNNKTKKLDIEQHQVKSIPLFCVKQEDGEFTSRSNVLEDPRRRLGADYPRKRQPPPEKCVKLFKNRNFLLATWSSGEIRHLMK